MRFQKIKSLKEIAIPGVSIELDETDSSLRTVTFLVGDVPVCRVAMDNYSMQLQRIADPKTKEVYRVSGTILGLPVLKDFDTDWSAQEEASRLRRGVEIESNAVITVEKATVEVVE